MDGGWISCDGYQVSDTDTVVPSFILAHFSYPGHGRLPVGSVSHYRVLKYPVKMCYCVGPFRDHPSVKIITHFLPLFHHIGIVKSGETVYIYIYIYRYSCHDSTLILLLHFVFVLFLFSFFVPYSLHHPHAQPHFQVSDMVMP